MSARSLRRLVLTVLLGAAMLALGAAGLSVASVTTTFKGTTDQGRDVTVEVGDDGLVSKVVIKAKKRGCIRGKGVYRAPLDESTPTSFVDKKASTRRPGGLRVRVKSNITGEMAFDAEWAGTLRVKLRASDHGHVIFRCKTREIDWSATLVS